MLREVNIGDFQGETSGTHARQIRQHRDRELLRREVNQIGAIPRIRAIMSDLLHAPIILNRDAGGIRDRQGRR